MTRGSSPPGSSRRAGGYSPVLRLTADDMSPLFPCPKKFTFWDTTLLPRGTFWVRVPRRPARGRPKAVFLLLACCTQEEDAGPARSCRSSRYSAWDLSPRTIIAEILLRLREYASENFSH